MGKQWKQWLTIFQGSKITADRDCSNEIKRCLLLERKVMTNLDSILKSREASQGYGFSSGHVWMWELDCEESWALKNWCFWTVVLGKTLESPLDCKEIQPVHFKGDQSWMFIGRTDAEAETPILWPSHVNNWLIGKDSDAGRDWGQEEKGTTEDEMAGWHHRLDAHEFGWTLGVGDGQGGLACCNSWGHKESDTTERLIWSDLRFQWCHLKIPRGKQLSGLPCCLLILFWSVSQDWGFVLEQDLWSVLTAWLLEDNSLWPGWV